MEKNEAEKRVMSLSSRQQKNDGKSGRKNERNEIRTKPSSIALMRCLFFVVISRDFSSTFNCCAHSLSIHIQISTIIWGNGSFSGCTMFNWYAFGWMSCKYLNSVRIFYVRVWVDSFYDFYCYFILYAQNSVFSLFCFFLHE